MPVRQKIIVLALVEPGDVLPGSAQPVVCRDSDDDGTAHPEQTLRRQRHRRVGKALGQPGPTLAPGQPADMTLWRRIDDPPSWQATATLIDGEVVWTR